MAAGTERGDATCSPHEAPLGTPLLESAPRTSEALRFYEEPGLRERCVAAVAAGGDAPSSSGRAGPRELRALLPARVSGRVETPAEREPRPAPPSWRSRARGDRGAHRPAGAPLCYPVARLGPDRAPAGRARPATRPPSAARCRARPSRCAGGDLPGHRAHGRRLRGAAARAAAASRWPPCWPSKWRRRLAARSSARSTMRGTQTWTLDPDARAVRTSCSPCCPCRDVCLFPEASLATIAATIPALQAVEIGAADGRTGAGPGQKEPDLAAWRELHAVGTVADAGRGPGAARRPATASSWTGCAARAC